MLHHGVDILMGVSLLAHRHLLVTITEILSFCPIDVDDVDRAFLVFYWDFEVLFAQEFESMQFMLVIVQSCDYCVGRFMRIKSLAVSVIFVSLLILLHHLEWINSSPSLLSQHCELFVADFSTTIFVHKAVQLLNIIKADLKTQEINGLSEFIE